MSRGVPRSAADPRRPSSTDLEAGPRRLDTVHPRTGEPFALEVSAAGFAAGLRGALYSTTLSSLVPWTIARAAAGDFAPFLAQLTPLVDTGEAINLGMFLSVVCAEDVSRLAAGEAERLAGEGTLGRLSIAGHGNGGCTVWPAAEMPDRLLRAGAVRRPRRCSCRATWIR